MPCSSQQGAAHVNDCDLFGIVPQSEIMEDYPGHEPEDIQAALLYAADLSASYWRLAESKDPSIS
jgi:hypothetical protein